MKVGERNGQRTIDVSLLAQIPPVEYLIDTGDVLGIYIDSVLGKHNENPPVNFPQNGDVAPAAGFPVVVRENGTISLPMVEPLNVRGKTLIEVEEMIHRAYKDPANNHAFLKEGRERILVSLQRKRQTRVLVIRQDSKMEPMTNSFAGQMNLGTAKRGTAKVVSLPAYQNDVLNAMVATDGLPGLDAENAIYVIRRPTNRNGQNVNWTDDCNPEELIRRYRAENKPAVRGQSEGWEYFTRKSEVTENQSSPYDPQPWDLSNGAPTLWDREEARMERRNSLDQPPVRQTSNNFSQPYPTPIQSSNPVPQRQFAKSQGIQPQFTAPNNAQQPFAAPIGQPNWPSQTFGSAPSYQVPPLPTPGHSIPGDPSIATDSMNSTGLHEDQNGFCPAEGGVENGNDFFSGRRILRIPIRLGPDERIEISREDVILNDGDIIFVESRDSEVFYTAGLLGGGQFTLPRDKDLNIIEAIAIATSRPGVGVARQVGGVTALNADVTISPSNLVVIRQLPDGGEIPIKVDIYRARTDPSERIVIQPGDYIFLQYTPVEAVCAFIERHLFEGALLGLWSAQLNQNRN